MYLMHLTVLDVVCILSVDRKREVSKLNVGVVLIIAINELSNRENEFDVNSRNIRPSKITRYTVPQYLSWLCYLILFYVVRVFIYPKSFVCLFVCLFIPSFVLVIFLACNNTDLRPNMPEVTTGSRGYKQAREQADKFLSYYYVILSF